MRKYLHVIMLLLITTIFIVQCTKKGTAIIEPRFGNYSFSTFTVDTFRFRIILDGVTLTDSLVSPIDFFSKYVNFLGTGEGRLQVIDAKNNDQLVLDTMINLQTGNNNFSIVQFITGQKPYIPGLPANEPPPAAGNYKIRFQYLKGVAGFPEPNINPVKCIITNNNIPVDTTTLNLNGFTEFYEVSSTSNPRVILLRPSNGQLFKQNFTTTAITPINRSGFNTVIMRGKSTQAPIPNGPYLYDVIKVY